MNQSTLQWCGGFIAACLFSSLLCAEPAQPKQQEKPRKVMNLATQIGELASVIKEVMAEEKAETIAVDEFTGSGNLKGNLKANGGPGIQSLLLQELQRLKVTVDKKAPLRVKGDYYFVEKEIAIKIVAKIMDREGNNKLKVSFKSRFENIKFLPEERVLTFKSRKTEDLTRVINPTFSIPVNADNEDYTDTVTTALMTPGFVATDAKIRATKNSPFGLEILVKKTKDAPAEARAPTNRAGHALVPIGSGEFYEVKVYNDSKNEAAIQLFLDGIDVFAFSEDREAATNKPRYSHYIMSANSTLTITGWHHDNETAHMFAVKDYLPQAAPGLHVTGKLGTITAVFKASWEADKEPEDELGNARSAGSRFTAKGPRIDSQVEVVTRTIGVIRDSITVRYDRE